MSSLSDIERDIIIQCKKNDLRHQEMLYKHFYSYAMGISLRYSYSREEALEIVNDSFMKVFDKIHTYNLQLSFKAWLRKIVIHTAIDYYRKYAKYKYHLDIEKAASESSDLDAIDKLEVDDILKLLHELPQQYRLIFNLYEIEGYSHKEIGEMLNISESTSRTQLTRAKKKLRHLFQDFFDKSYEKKL
ncbi:MAG: sigma-70 family RNA polymerase sigma factor [Microscillaceae bacterium]|nr:sigma-70 family RNA polymerase sigma factor [Microscillaceae bacterium]